MVACSLKKRLAIVRKSKDRCGIYNHHDMVSLLVEFKNTTFLIYETSLSPNFIRFFCLLVKSALSETVS